MPPSAGAPLDSRALVRGSQATPPHTPLPLKLVGCPESWVEAVIWGGAELATLAEVGEGRLAGRIGEGARIPGVWEKLNSGSPTHSVAVVEEAVPGPEDGGEGAQVGKANGR